MAIIERTILVISERETIIKASFYGEHPNVGLCTVVSEGVDPLRLALGGVLIAMADILASVTCLSTYMHAPPPSRAHELD